MDEGLFRLRPGAGHHRRRLRRLRGGLQRPWAAQEEITAWGLPFCFLRPFFSRTPQERVFPAFAASGKILDGYKTASKYERMSI